MSCHSLILELVTVSFRVLQLGWREEEIFTLTGILIVGNLMCESSVHPLEVLSRYFDSGY
jgi:hypothetical protein